MLIFGVFSKGVSSISTLVIFVKMFVKQLCVNLLYLGTPISTEKIVNLTQHNATECVNLLYLGTPISTGFVTFVFGILGSVNLLYLGTPIST